MPDIHVEEIDVAANPAVAVKYGLMATPGITINGRLAFTALPRPEALLDWLQAAERARPTD